MKCKNKYMQKKSCVTKYKKNYYTRKKSKLKNSVQILFDGKI